MSNEEKALVTPSRWKCNLALLLSVVGSFSALFWPFFFMFFRRGYPSRPIYVLEALIGAVLLLLGGAGVVGAFKKRALSKIAIFGIAIGMAMVIFVSLSAAVHFIN